jgi:hypothetical protein
MMPAATWPLSARDGFGAAVTVIAAVAIAAIIAGNLVMVYPLLLHTKLGPAQSLLSRILRLKFVQMAASINRNLFFIL